jgi:hypothetical protein
MKKLETIDEPTVIGGFMAKTKFKLDGIRYRKLQTAKWDQYHVY